jgi:hypothetical protein
MFKKRMAQTHITNLRAYLLKQAIDGRVIHIELESVRECSRLLGSIANNVNQLARHANSGGNVYGQDLQDVKQNLDRVLEQQSVIAANLAKMVGSV